MQIESDLLLERQKIRRKLVLWRCMAIIIFVVSVASIIVSASLSKMGSGGDHLVKLKIEGIIGSDVSKQVKLIDDALADKSIKGLILCVNSPGGAVTGGEQLHDAVMRFAKEKPVVVSMGGVAASAGYMISVPANRIFALNSTLTGSIGVIMQAPDISGLLGKVGITVDQLVSGPLKGQPSMVKPLSPQGREMLQGLIENFYDQFVGMVAQGRHMDVAKVKELGDGRPYSGQQAVNNGLVDQIGTEQDAKKWLAQYLKLSSDIKVIELKNKKPSKWFSRFMGETLGDTMNGVMQQALYNSHENLDGAIAIWKP
ncbi:signal peptide peptidase SppA [Commensalibacter papalotli (ex Botero et al. 2024)]|uniref:ClpP class (SppA) (PDB:3BEZ) n=1 Tax=Commensalibacter papalotli (ex Botero et al. 2024) TaxID=2972766 RepID=A0ABM9HMA7_9PROT|nr:signal peptide peptidase SppA [Commensalibacter papalotli (ex Botero et al. 2024)]CAI3936463.1 ClpP class (SppA) (PDB:3BEZ) [Commensalibacter papalotli (ex Botero et al. 2024)]CAI3939185.1 ClpP class (SppA) (PDB:3BEZ) [Commensalibacter papalotli (ex Botero et al. 2024)]